MKTIENINEIHIHKSIVFLYIGNDQLDIEIKKKTIYNSVKNV